MTPKLFCVKLTPEMARIKNITRYEAGKGRTYTFKGYRLCITRRKERFVRYFSDREYSSGEKALEAATQMRSSILDELARSKQSPAVVFARYRKVYE